jgi:hypothetical protein
VLDDGQCSGFIAGEFEVSRQQMDEFALSSHRKAIEAIDAGLFKDEVVPVESGRKRDRVIDTDALPRRDTSWRRWRSCPPRFLVWASDGRRRPRPERRRSGAGRRKPRTCR